MTKIKQGRDVIGRFHCTGKNMTVAQAVWFYTKIMVIVGLVGFGLVKFGVFTKTFAIPTAKADTETYKDISDEVLAIKIDKMKDKVVDQISSCENPSGNDGLIIFDSNKVASLGSMQWQVASVIYFTKMQSGRVITGTEAIQIAIDHQKAHDLAKYVMFETKNMAGKDWVNCSNRFDSDNQIKLIKQLENN